jgi:hypothetical protein
MSSALHPKADHARASRAQHLAAMTERHTELFEIILGQIADN